MAGGPKPFGIVDSHFKYLVFKDPHWEFRNLNFDSDVALADKLDNNTINATDPNLKEFVAHGDKLTLYHGWYDQLIAPRITVNYYNNVLAAMGGAQKVGNSICLFMAPGVIHCFGGDGPYMFDTVTALEQWVEKGKAPDQIIASHLTGGKVDRTRPLCSYPQIAKHCGAGSADDATNFVCAPEQRDDRNKASKQRQRTKPTHL